MRLASGSTGPNKSKMCSNAPSLVAMIGSDFVPLIPGPMVRLMDRNRIPG